MGATDVITLVIRSEVDKAMKDLSNVNNQMTRLGTTSDKMTGQASGLKTAWVAATAAAVTMAAALGKVVKAASDLNEAENYFKTVFGNAMGTASKGIDELNSKYAMSRREAMQLTAEIGSLLKPMGFASKEAAEMSINVVKLAADLGSLKNVKTEDALIAIRSALSGEAEPMKRFGVNVNETALKMEAMRLGLKTTGGQLDANAKAMAAYSIIMKGTKDAQGDMIRTQDEFANQLKKAKANTEDMSSTIGSKLLPAVNLFLKDFNKLSGSELGESIGEVIAGVILLFNAIAPAYEMAVRKIQDVVLQMQHGIYTAGTAISEIFDKPGADSNTKGFFREKLEDTEIYLKTNEKLIHESEMKMNGIQSTWAKIKQKKEKEVYKDSANAMNDAMKEKRMYTEQELAQAAKSKQEVLEYVGMKAEAEISKEDEKYRKMLAVYKSGNLSIEQVQQAHSKKMSEIQQAAIMEQVGKVSNVISTMGSIASSITGNLQQIGALQTKAVEQELQQQQKVVDMYFQAQQKQNEDIYNEQLAALENWRASELQMIDNTVADVDDRNNRKAQVDKDYIKKKEKIDKDKAAQDKKTEQEQLAIKQFFDIQNMILKHRAGLREREMGFASAMIAAGTGAAATFGQTAAAFAFLPGINLAIAAAAAAAVFGMGMALALAIKSTPVPFLAGGGLIRGSNAGTLVNMSEGGRSEAILPLENKEALNKMRAAGLGGGGTIVVNVENLYGGDDLPYQVAQLIDKGLTKLARDGRSSFAEAI